MSDNIFEIAFKGVVAPGADPSQVRKNLAALFKTDPAKIEPLFSGRRIVVKKGLDQATAIKYQRALREAGALVEVVKSAAAQAPSSATAVTQQPARPSANGAASAQSSPLAGGDTLNSRSATRPARGETGDAVPPLSVDPPGVVLVEPEKSEPLRVDLTHLKLDPPGVTLVAATTHPGLQVNLEGITMAEPGAVLKKPDMVEERKIDTSALTMAEPGAVLVEPEQNAAADIDTSGIRLA